MGLVMLGSGSVEIIDEMLQYGHETQHEKIIRGLAIGIAFICYGKQEQANSTIEKLLAEKVCARLLTFITIHLNRLLYFRTLSSAMVERTVLPWHTLALRTMELFRNCFILLFRTPRTMSAELLLLPSHSSFSRTLIRCLVWFNF